MAKKVQINIKDVTYILGKGIPQIIKDYRLMQQVFDYLVDIDQNNTNDEIATAAGFKATKIYRRKNNPELWKDEEILKLRTHLKIDKMEQDLKKEQKGK